MSAVDPAPPVPAQPRRLRVVGEPAHRPSVVVVDWNVTRTSPIGSSVLAVLAGLHDRYRFVVVAAYFENPSPDTIEHVRVRLPRVPTFVKELCWPTIAGLGLRRRRLGRLPGAVTRATQGQFPGADIVCAHFCHRAYLSEYFPKAGTRGLRRISRFVVHRHGANLERRAFRRARVISVPSLGLAREIERTYPFAAEKIRHIPNPVDTARFAREEQFDRAAARAELGFRPDDVVYVFVALGDFGRKGLEIGLRGLAAAAPSDARLLVVGGTKGEIGVFQGIAEKLGLADHVRFVGLQQDVRPYLWLSDAFLFPDDLRGRVEGGSAGGSSRAADYRAPHQRHRGRHRARRQRLVLRADARRVRRGDPYEPGVEGCASGDGRTGATRRSGQRHPLLRPALGRVADACPA